MFQIKNKIFSCLGKGSLFLLIASTSIAYAQDDTGSTDLNTTSYEEINVMATIESEKNSIVENDPYSPINPSEDQILGDAVQPGEIAPPEESQRMRARAGGLNQEIIYNAEHGIFTRPEIKIDWRTYSMFPYKDLAGKNVNAPLGIVIHETANAKSTIWNEIDYMDRNWTSAFVHAFVDQGNIVEIHDPSYGAWGAGKVANQYFIHIELVEHPGNRTAFMKSVLNDAHYAARKLHQFGLTPSRPSGVYGDPNGTIWSHHEVSSYLGGTNHTDPTGYFKQFGYSMAEFFELVQYEYDQLIWDSNNSSDTGWKKLENGLLSYWVNGQAVTGWQKINNAFYLFGESTAMATGWQYLNSNWYYLNTQSGKMLTGWQYINNKWYFLHGSGDMAKGWKNLGTWYYLSNDGSMRTGWQNINTHWYYLGESGSMRTGWQNVNNHWYYLNGSGEMNTGWKDISGNWYYLDESGSMRIGWQTMNGHWYYLNGNGQMQKGWRSINGQWYYLNGSGDMARNWLQLGNQKYYLGNDGAMRNGWQNIDGKMYYFNNSGSLK